MLILKFFQTVDGFGYTLTGGSASLINGITIPEKNNLLKEIAELELLQDELKQREKT